ncbi:alpha/beta fold hydrolase [Arthrobacter agilis]|uniref:alpha/beta fold hydrolase n=1 Tax=Arthrobacter agilis TaxID=37921 RepID=UPI000B35EBAC|nr:alpha/beta fold hydrolase [Arthrobacter agilis]OUM44828.1 hydrolase [Arthrobacter agilis]PPB47152.1 hydrolase [Arthrobacter agilis]TPV22566.1 alpha/beta fold hydrolase [Arthrobacter agilis]
MVALPGVDPSWSAYLDVPSTSTADAPGTSHRWHYLDNGAGADGTPVKGTLLCVHGNPTWSFLWRTYLAAGLPEGWRVVAVDQLDMGYSARTGVFRRLEHRITDLGDFVAALGLHGPVVTVGHDWGGVVSLGYAHRNREDLAGVILTNTAIHQEPDRPIPAPLRLALAPGVHGLGTRTTTAFLDVTLALARPALQPEVRAAFRAPYGSAADRGGIANFVSDIPADPSHPSYAVLTSTAEGIRSLDVPVLMMWGPRDPIFSDPYLEDLARRLPHADIHRFERASHLVQEDADTAATAMEWLTARAVAVAPPVDGPRADPEAGAPDTTGEDAPYSPLGQRLRELAAGPGSSATAVAEMTADGPRTLSWKELDDDVSAVAAGLAALGYGPGSRVSLLVPPGLDLTVLIYAFLRGGAVIVVADAGLGARGLSRAVRSAAPDVVIGIERALLAARAFGWPGKRISATTLPAARRRALRVDASLGDLRAARADAGLAEHAAPDDDAAILFTSGSTGPAKGVVYTNRRLSAMRDAVESTLGLGPGASLVAGFAPFALLGPALGATSVTPDMDVTAPGTLTAQALADAAAAVEATVVFASPAALRNVLATSDELSSAGRSALGRISLMLSAGAPIPLALLESVQDLVPAAALHTPYGMTESLLVADIELDGVRRAAAAAAAGQQGAGNGVCVGLPVHRARVAVSPLSISGPGGDAVCEATGAPTTQPGVTGEILVEAPHVKDRYFRLWRTQQDAARTTPWHRTGDIGHFDAEGRLWVEGRLGHVITSAEGIVTPVGLEHALQELDDVRLAAVVGVGPVGTQAVVAVVETAQPEGRGRRGRLADAGLAAGARAVARDCGIDLAAVIAVPALPVDIRHNAKIDRAAVGAWAAVFLSGGRAGSL